jgi:alginate O-acetyltransferase complex protein AlgI
MLFNSFEFLIFFPAVTILFYLLPHKVRWVLLLAASCLFYCYFIPSYLLILLFLITVDYFAAILIEQSVQKKKWLVCSIIANLCMLGLFKYYNFFAVNINTAAGLNIPLLNLILPIGLSFHTFQAMSYTIEVYRGNCKAERHFGIYA